MFLRPSCVRLRPVFRAVTLALCLGLSAAGVAAALPLTEARRPRPFELESPRPGETWVAGEWATISWAPAGSDADRAGLEEWEAFLSVDDGRTYAVRLTPHLDIDLYRFTFEVPGLPTREARLLLRFGDEREEHGFEIPARFVIVADERRLSPFGALASVRLREGERARENDPGAVLQTEGSRRGGGLRTEVSLPISTSLSGADLEAGALFYLLLGGPSNDRLVLPALAESRLASPPRDTGVHLAQASATPAASPSIRLLIHRFNE